MTSKMPRYSARAAALSILTGVALLGTSPAVADPISYSVRIGTAGPIAAQGLATGSITTNGTVGVLQPEDILSWQLTITVTVVTSVSTETFGSASGGTVSSEKPFPIHSFF
jgi:hypothetical protein